MSDVDVPVLAALRNVHKHYGAVPALHGLDLEVRAGEVLALLGANGAGKSTAVGLMLGLLKPDAGTVALLGRSPALLSARRGAGVMLQAAGIPDACKVRELLELTRSYYPSPRSRGDCVELAGLHDLLDRRYGRLSGGQQRRVQFAMALCGRPRVLFLDEPTTGLDVASRQRLWDAIRAVVAEGSGVVLTTHYLEEAEALADRVVVLQRGRIAAQGTVQAIRAHVSQRHIRCVSALSARLVATWPQVREARRAGERLELVVDGAAEAVLRGLLAADPSLEELEVRRAGLAEAFLALTRDPDTADLQEAA